MFGFFEEEDDSDEVTVKEDSAGIWHYHLAEPDSTRSLCGEVVMGTSLGLEEWDTYHSDLQLSYCDECEQIYNDR